METSSNLRKRCGVSPGRSLAWWSVRPAMCTVTEVSLRKGPLSLADLIWENLLPGQLIGRLALGCGDWPQTRCSQPDWLLFTEGPQTWFPQSPTVFSPPYSSTLIPPLSPPLCAHSVHLCLMHTRAQLFVYVEIFSNRACEGYTAAGKHWVLRWRVSVLSLLFVYNISLLQRGDIWLMEEIWEYFSFDSSHTRVSDWTCLLNDEMLQSGQCFLNVFM